MAGKSLITNDYFQYLYSKLGNASLSNVVSKFYLLIFLKIKIIFLDFKLNYT